jgi:hypothetical protein
MSRSEDVLTAYRAHRLEAQLQWYDGRVKEFRTARNQARLTAAILLVVAAVLGAMASVDIVGWRTWWALAATVVGGLSAALTSYEAAFGFDRQARDYERARAAMTRVALRWPGSPCRAIEGDGVSQIATFVRDAEAGFLSEVDQWAKQASVEPAPLPPAGDAASSS